MNVRKASQQDEPICVLPLCAPEAALPDLAGAKAANLSRLLAAGFPVPDGIVVTTAAFTAHVGAVITEPGQDGDAIVKKPLPTYISEALCDALLAFGDEPLAVRSSGVAEDLDGASFAGQYETILGVSGHASVADAVRKCWASLYSSHINSYRMTRGLTVDRVAVLIQPLVAADAAGVAFTANPVTGDRCETVVNAVRGFGERLVSGQATPDEWVVRDSRAVCCNAPEGALFEYEVLAVAELARRVEQYFGYPQDIEWAISGGRLYLLQARPITTLPPVETTAPEYAHAEPPPGFWERADSHYPEPLYPLTRSTLLPAANQGFRRMCREFGLLMETVEEREIGGWVYLRMVPLGGKDRLPPPDWLMRLLVYLLPSLRTRIRGCQEAVRSDKAGQWIERWHTEFKQNFVKRLTELRNTSLPALSDECLDRYAGEVNHLLQDSQEIHMMLNLSLNLVLAEFVFTCQDLLGWGEERIFDLLIGLSATSSAPARALARIARLVRENPALQEMLNRTDPGTVERMGAIDNSFVEAFNTYQWEFGCRAIGYEVAEPTLAEKPELSLAMIKNQVRRMYDPEADARLLAETRASLRAEASRVLSGRSTVEQERFERVLNRAERAYPVREEHGFYDTGMPLALLRYAVLEMGHRLVERRQIAAPVDVFCLELDEACSALKTGNKQQDLVLRRKGERAWVLAHPGPASYGTYSPKAPSFAYLPVEVRLVYESIMWFGERVFAAATSRTRQSEGLLLEGIPASAGSYTGPVRVIMDESEFYRIQAGDVLVCPITSPAWSVLFSSVGALVTDSGGFLSHSAIIAREYRIPAVVATGNATQLLHDGQVVTVDGSNGTILLDELVPL